MSRDIGLLVLRVGVGLMMAGHGWGKVVDVFHRRFQFPDPLGIGPAPSLILTAFAEFVCAILVVIGFKTRWSAVPAAIAMLVAALLFHLSDPWPKKEHALLFAVPFVALMLTGAGRISLDGWLGQRKR